MMTMLIAYILKVDCVFAYSNVFRVNYVIKSLTVLITN